MTGALVAFCLWVVAAHAVALIPSRRNHWPQAWALVASGIPILGWVTWQNGALIGLLTLAAGASVLRWPLRRFSGWVGRKVRGG